MELDQRQQVDGGDPPIPHIPRQLVRYDVSKEQDPEHDRAAQERWHYPPIAVKLPECGTSE